MIIYQIHEHYGEYEDYRDIIVGTYLSKEKAMLMKKQLEEENEEIIKKYERCHSCPLFHGNELYTEKDVISGTYCDLYEPFDEMIHDPDEYADTECVNYDTGYYDLYSSYYKIKSVEVME